MGTDGHKGFKEVPQTAQAGDTSAQAGDAGAQAGGASVQAGGASVQAGGASVQAGGASVQAGGALDDQIVAARLDIASQLASLRPTFVALGDETRQHVLYTLLKGDRSGMRVGEIQELTYLSRPTVTHHLEVLMDVGLVVRRQEGRMSFYCLRGDYATWRAIEHLAKEVRETAEASDTGV
ncbi:MAG: metalloregulator ArsR/SmtB family transcription factor [Olegusella sp.]|nr:metalloregulator ArsR/SmtB family transcription factor [Olegusella sp.]